jgi:hypothetical protein
MSTQPVVPAKNVKQEDRSTIEKQEQDAQKVLENQKMIDADGKATALPKQR